MSSSTFSTELTPNPRLRRIVVLSGCCTTVLGLVTILTLSIGPQLSLAAAAVWLMLSVRELRVITRGYKCCRGIRIAANGDVAVRISERDWRTARLASGSVVLAGLAWLRIETHDGQRFAELLSGNCRKNKKWRRLQVIWRHLGTAA